MPVKNSAGNFATLPSTPKYRLIVRSWGVEKSGKNHFGFTGPGPIYGQYFDPGGTEGVADKFLRGEVGGAKDIKAVCYKFKKGQTSQAAVQELRDQFIEDYEVALKNARLVQWDETEVWELFRWAEFDGESDAPKNYGALNAKYRALIQSAYDAGVNLHLIQKVKEKWTTNVKGSPVPSGVFEPVGFKEAGYIVQVNLEHSYVDGVFGIRIANCRQNMSLSGQEFPELDWPTLGQLVFTESEQGDWE